MNAIDKNIFQTQTADLVRAAQAGDRAAFGTLFERFQPNRYGDRDATFA